MSKSEQSLPTQVNLPIFRTAYGGPYRMPQVFEGEDKTKQSHKDECDINNIMRRYMATGQLEHVRDELPQYIDATGYDYQEAQNFIASANSLFAELPSEVRARFDNDPAQLLDFVHDPKNAQEAVQMGFLDETKLPQGWGGLNLPPPPPAPSGAALEGKTEGGKGAEAPQGAAK